MKTKTQTDTQHTPAAVRIAAILIPPDFTGRGRKTIETAWGRKTREGIADLIDNESGVPELLALLHDALAFVLDGQLVAHRRSLETPELVSRESVAKAIRAAIAGDAPLASPEPVTITIRVHGGVVQDVEDVPAGVTVRVVDYDVDGCGDDETEDVGGERARVALYEGSAQ